MGQGLKEESAVKYIMISWVKIPTFDWLVEQKSRFKRALYLKSYSLPISQRFLQFMEVGGVLKWTVCVVYGDWRGEREPISTNVDSWVGLCWAATEPSRAWSGGGTFGLQGDEAIVISARVCPPPTPLGERQFLICSGKKGSYTVMIITCDFRAAAFCWGFSRHSWVYDLPLHFDAWTLLSTIMNEAWHHFGSDDQKNGIPLILPLLFFFPFESFFRGLLSCVLSAVTDI